MRRIGRWMLNALTVLSLLLCVGTCVLWVRSYWVADDVSWVNKAMTRLRVLSTERGGLTFESWHGRLAGKVNPPGLYYLHTEATKYYPGASDRSTCSHFAGSAYRTHFYGGVSGTITDWTLPLPLMLAALAVAPACGLVGLVRRRRFLAGHCDKCGYDLTANVSGVCPECGTKIAEAK